jgi:hypothetical protein
MLEGVTNNLGRSEETGLLYAFAVFAGGGQALGIKFTAARRVSVSWCV